MLSRYLAGFTVSMLVISSCGGASSSNADVGRAAGAAITSAPTTAFVLDSIDLQSLPGARPPIDPNGCALTVLTDAQDRALVVELVRARYGDAAAAFVAKSTDAQIVEAAPRFLRQYAAGEVTGQTDAEIRERVQRLLDPPRQDCAIAQVDPQQGAGVCASDGTPQRRLESAIISSMAGLAANGVQPPFDSSLAAADLIITWMNTNRPEIIAEYGEADIRGFVRSGFESNFSMWCDQVLKQPISPGANAVAFKTTLAGTTAYHGPTWTLDDRHIRGNSVSVTRATVADDGSVRGVLINDSIDSLLDLSKVTIGGVRLTSPEGPALLVRSGEAAPFEVSGSTALTKLVAAGGDPSQLLESPPAAFLSAYPPNVTRTLEVNTYHRANYDHSTGVARLIGEVMNIKNGYDTFGIPVSTDGYYMIFAWYRADGTIIDVITTSDASTRIKYENAANTIIVQWSAEFSGLSREITDASGVAIWAQQAIK